MQSGSGIPIARSFGILLLLYLGWTQPVPASQQRPRLVVLTDFYRDPDDKQSMIRLLSYANEFEIEGIIATSLADGEGTVHPDWLIELIGRYGMVVENLRKHERAGHPFPSADLLRSVVKAGAPVIRKWVGQGKGFEVPYPPGERDSRSCETAMNWIGPGKDTEASEHIIGVVDRKDERPVWIVVWGGAMDLAQAVWKVRHERAVEEAAEFVNKLRVYQVSWQDTGAVWLWHNCPDLFLIQSSSAYRGMYAEWSPGGREEWVDQNVRNGHGSLGAAYPRAGRSEGIKEGDSPSFLYVLPSGLGDPEHPEWGGWGGRFRRIDSRRQFYVDASDGHPDSRDRARESQWTVGRWNLATTNAFASRLDWCVEHYEHANHHPIVYVEGDSRPQAVHHQVPAGELVRLDSTGTYDPDGDAFDVLWWQYLEASTFAGNFEIRNARSSQASFLAPSVQQRQTVHIILEVTDQGQPPLTAYRRLVFDVTP